MDLNEAIRDVFSEDNTKWNTLEIDIRKISKESMEDTVANDIKNMTIAMQCLPIPVGQLIKLYITTSRGETQCWNVIRKSEVIYRFISNTMPLAGDYYIGDIEDEVAVKNTLGWYDVKFKANPYYRGSKLENYVWMGGEMAGFIGAVLIAFFKEVDRLSLYPFVTKPTTDPKSVKNPAKRKKIEAQVNQIVYLGRPPCPTPTSSDAISKPREFGYPRRQHRRTLRAERFKNHPKYRVYKGVLVGQSWCGPKEYIHKKKIYRLWEPPSYDVSG